MKQLFILVLAINLILPFGAKSQTISLTQEDALSIVKEYYEDQDVDYYLCGNSSTGWRIFVDEEPLKGWEHKCCLYTFHNSTNMAIAPIPLKQDLLLPPNEDLIPLDVKNRYGIRATEKPNVSSTNVSNVDLAVAERTYAVILSGGVNKNSNYERYWNDCSFIYQTLVYKYGIPRSNIIVIMSDGTNPAADMLSVTSQYKSSPLDLDFDGNNDIQYSATLSNVQNVLNNLSINMSENDHLFFYVIDHGGTTDYISDSYICLWGNEKLYDYTLANWLTPFTNKYINVNVVLGQCFSGGFIDNLTKVGCVVATASKGNESSWACNDIPYDEFVYHWTTAINEANSYGVSASSDLDNNGKITMEEAFLYAQNNDKRNENPQYVSTPNSVGEDLAFNNLAPTVDLYIRDNIDDTGKEPNLTTETFWNSPDVWVRNNDDGISVHENPYYASDHLASIVYVRVTNRGKKKFDGTNRWVHVNWAMASTGLTVKAWKGRELYNNSYVTGGALTPASIPELEPGESKVVKLTWALPTQLMDENPGQEKHHFCLVARILDISYVDEYHESDPDWFDMKGINDYAQKNVSIINKMETRQGTNVYVRNIHNTSHKYSLEIRPSIELDAQIFTKAKVEMIMSQPILQAWERGGSQYISLSYSPTIDPRKVVFTSAESKLKNISLVGNEFEKVTMKFDFHSTALRGTKYTIDLIQRDESGNIVGGETFIVEAPNSRNDSIVITPIDLENGDIKLTANLDGTESLTEWKDSQGAIISNTNSVIVSPVQQNNTYSLKVLDSEGDLATGNITLESVKSIKSANPTTNVTDFIDIELNREELSSNSLISVNSVMNGLTMLNISVPVGNKNIRINTSSLSSGVYVLSYIVNGQIVDSIRFSK